MDMKTHMLILFNFFISMLVDGGKEWECYKIKVFFYF
jgi:hypothetical protein